MIGSGSVKLVQLMDQLKTVQTYIVKIKRSLIFIYLFIFTKAVNQLVLLVCGEQD